MTILLYYYSFWYGGFFGMEGFWFLWYIRFKYGEFLVRRFLVRRGFLMDDLLL